MKIKLIDVETDTHQAEFGTCELCFSTGIVDEPVFVLKTSTGKEYKVDAYEWDWGDYDELGIDNVIDFAAWLNEIEFDDDIVPGTYWLFNLVNDYNDEKHYE